MIKIGFVRAPVLVLALSAFSVIGCRRDPNKSDPCSTYRSATDPRRFGYELPGDPSTHPGCVLTEAGDLQCPEDFEHWTPKSKVVVPLSEAKGLLDEAEAAAFAARCAACPRDDSRNWLPGANPTLHPARLCKAGACIEVCGPERGKLQALRAKFASTRTPSTVRLIP